MAKNWLIRTKSNHILGPISKEKVQELYRNSSIKADDEICSGNGFWFFIREEEMVTKFLTGNEVQGFNPISEAKDVLIAHPSKSKPDITKDDITVIKGISLSSIKGDIPKEALVSEPKVEEEPQPTPAPVKKKSSSSTPKVKEEKPRKPLPKQSYLRYLIFAGIILILGLLFFRKDFIKEFLSSVTLMSEAVAQDSVPAEKKNSSADQ